jgi:predicted RNA-binding Zn ribbon-like protein
MNRTRQASAFRPAGVAGHAALDFVNTVPWSASPAMARPAEGERLVRYRDLVRWARDAGLLTSERAATLLQAGERDSRAADHALQHAIHVRGVIRAVFHYVAGGAEPPASALDALVGEVATAWQGARIVVESGSAAVDWGRDPADLGQVIRPVVTAAADLLLDERLARVRECASERCRWLFLDSSRNGLRRWCDMRVCGSRAKARRYYSRQRVERGA